MLRLSELKLPLTAAAAPEADLRAAAARVLGVPAADISRLQVFKRSFDARKAELLAVYIVDLALRDMRQEDAVLARLGRHPHVAQAPDMRWQPPVHDASLQAPRPVVIGFGPCGIFAALALAQMGFRPLVLERGREVRRRTQDTWNLWRRHVLHPESNVQFGEGGAGTFSDGKLYSQIKDPRWLGRKVMEEFVRAGAPPEILVHAHPHIGTFKLVKVVENLRAQIQALGGEIRFEQRVVDFHVEQGTLRGLEVLDLASGQTHSLPAQQAVLAPGHSARDTFVRLWQRGVAMEAKPFSIGFRIEHPQGQIDRARWGRHAGNALLGAADYKLVHHASNGRSVYSFCMCPGGTVVAATSEPGRVVTNGMSQYSRNERNANAGIVVGIDPTDFPSDVRQFAELLGEEVRMEPGSTGSGASSASGPVGSWVHPLAGVVLQRQLEASAFVLGGSRYEAPAQLVGDFLAGRASRQLGEVLPSYQPGVQLVDLAAALPGYAIAALREALPAFAARIRGFDRADAVFTGVETRTSAPLRVHRGEDLQSPTLRGLYPAGEGCGYAGGILSAAVDGIKVAEALARAAVGTGT